MQRKNIFLALSLGSIFTGSIFTYTCDYEIREKKLTNRCRVDDERRSERATLYDIETSRRVYY